VSTCTIFIPSYQAAATITGVIERIPKDMWERIPAVHVINDGSTDDTDAVVTALTERFPKVQLHSQPTNGGYGMAVRRGLKLSLATGGDYVVCLHADGQYPPEKLPDFLPYMEEHGVDVLQGSRHAGGTAREGGMPGYKILSGKVLTWMENRTFDLQMTDYHSGFILYSRKAVESIPFDTLSHYFEFDLEVIACARERGLVIHELAIPTHYGDEESHLNPIRYGLRCLRVMARYKLGRYRP